MKYRSCGFQARTIHVLSLEAHFITDIRIVRAQENSERKRKNGEIKNMKSER
jgi:hypothetical protein